ncbi:MAG: addiction module antitoxin [Gammaproteobacteria bacterium RIFCSPLOWO2_02_FULL_56_15]|nr:MAG: addiction module antitoxin [Gammaproteobacteria bacterium RIFCSPLOWO2_02_FULL_56_15]
MATMNVSIPDQMREWVESQIASGVYSNASDYIRDLIRRDQEYKDKREVLIRALETGKKSGISNRAVDEIWKEVKTQHR